MEKKLSGLVLSITSVSLAALVTVIAKGHTQVTDLLRGLYWVTGIGVVSGAAAICGFVQKPVD